MITTAKQTFTIERVQANGKYYEFWFAELAHEGAGRRFDACCKRYVLEEAMGGCNSALFGEILTTGLKGRKTIWKNVNGNRDLASFLLTECVTEPLNYFAPMHVSTPAL